MKALIINNEVRDIDVYEYYHKDIAKLFVDCLDNVEIGFSYVEGEFIPPIVEDETEVSE